MSSSSYLAMKASRMWISFAFDRLGRVLSSLSYDSGTSRVTAWFLPAKPMLLVQPNNPRFSYEKIWSYIIKSGLNAATFLI